MREVETSRSRSRSPQVDDPFAAEMQNIFEEYQEELSSSETVGAIEQQLKSGGYSASLDAAKREDGGLEYLRQFRAIVEGIREQRLGLFEDDPPSSEYHGRFLEGGVQPVKWRNLEVDQVDRRYRRRLRADLEPVPAQPVRYLPAPGGGWGDVLVPQQNDRAEVVQLPARPSALAHYTDPNAPYQVPAVRAPRPRVARPPRAARGGQGFAPMRAYVPVPRHTKKVQLHVQPTMSMGRSTAYTSLSSGDLVAPSTGRVHLVGMGNYGDRNEHFLAQMDADANMGAKKVMKKQGPFKGQSGDSYVMERSAHTSFRRRGNGIEITVRRGVSGTEVEKLIGRLAAHRMSVHTTFVYLIEGSKRRKLGRLSEIDLEKLKAKIYTLLTKRPHLGIHLVDEADTGVLHAPGIYKRKMTKFARHL